MSTPELHIETLFVLDRAGRILRTREPHGTPGPSFFLARGKTSCAWAAHASVPEDLAVELGTLARQERPATNFHDPPLHAERYGALLGGEAGLGAAFTFPERLDNPGGVAELDDERPLAEHFRGWLPGELAAGRAPLFAIVSAGHAVSVCFCSRRSGVAAEAGLETAAAFRGRGYGARVAIAWALALRASGLVPLYSTSHTNTSSLAVARKLGLLQYATTFSISPPNNRLSRAP